MKFRKIVVVWRQSLYFGWVEERQIEIEGKGSQEELERQRHRITTIKQRTQKKLRRRLSWCKKNQGNEKKKLNIPFSPCSHDHGACWSSLREEGGQIILASAMKP
jgi:hypothetical protein